MKGKISRLAAFVGLWVVVSLAGWFAVYAATTTANVSVSSAVRVNATGTPDQGSLTWDIGTSGVSTQALANGSGSLQVNKVYVKTAAVTTTVDLDSSLIDPAGSTISFSRIAFVRIVPGAANAAALTLGGDFILTKYLVPGGDTLTNTKIPINLLGRFEFLAPNATGIAITAATGDEITVTVTGSDSFSIVVLGS